MIDYEKLSVTEIELVWVWMDGDDDYRDSWMNIADQLLAWSIEPPDDDIDSSDYRMLARIALFHAAEDDQFGFFKGAAFGLIVFVLWAALMFGLYLVFCKP